MTPDAMAKTPLLSDTDMETPEHAPASHQNATSNNSDSDMQFYDPSAILDISRDVALGYLILLTGGMLEYEPPTPEELSSAQNLPQDDSQQLAPTNNQHKPATTTLDEESASLAYAAIVDGNVLHACFGLKATASGNFSIPTIGDKHEQPSLLCCFPTSSSALQLVLPHAAKNKLKMQNLMEILREVGDLHHEESDAALAADDATKMSVYMKVIQAYTICFTAIVRFHDAKNIITKSDRAKNKGKYRSEGNVGCFSNIFKKLKVFTTSKCNPRLEQLRNDTLGDIEHGFQGLKEGIWESLESMAAETAFTGVSMEGSPLRGRGKNI